MMRQTCGRDLAFSLRNLAIRLRVTSRRKSACSESSSRKGWSRSTTLRSNGNCQSARPSKSSKTHSCFQLAWSSSSMNNIHLASIRRTDGHIYRVCVCFISKSVFLPSYIWAYCGNPVALNQRHASVASNSVNQHTHTQTRLFSYEEDSCPSNERREDLKTEMRRGNDSVMMVPKERPVDAFVRIKRAGSIDGWRRITDEIKTRDEMFERWRATARWSLVLKHFSLKNCRDIGANYSTGSCGRMDNICFNGTANCFHGHNEDERTKRRRLLIPNVRFFTHTAFDWIF